MRSKIKEFKGGSIEYRIPIYTDLLRIYSKLDMEKLAELKTGKQTPDSLAAIADCMDAINSLILRIDYKDYTSKEEAMSDMGIIEPMIQIFQDVMAMISQNGGDAKKRKK